MQTYTGPEEERVKDIFKSVADQYDRANDVITGGMHRGWRKRMLVLSGAQKGDHVLDCASGTGDLAIEFKKVVGPEGRVLATDFCEDMLKHVPGKAEKAGVEVEVETADATKLPYEDASFDITTIGFGIRNVNDPLKALSEMARVTKRGGQILILETGKMDHPILAPFYRLYTRNILPWLGGMVTGQRGAYEYLQNSSSQFPSKDEFLALMHKTGMLEQCEYEMYLGGATYIYRGRKK